MFLLVSVRHVGAHPDGHQHGVSIQICILTLWKHSLGYVVYEIFLWPESWRGSLYIYLLSFPRLWTLSIERLWFLFWSISNGETLKTRLKAEIRAVDSQSDLRILLHSKRCRCTSSFPRRESLRLRRTFLAPLAWQGPCRLRCSSHASIRPALEGRGRKLVTLILTKRYTSSWRCSSGVANAGEKPGGGGGGTSL